MAAACLWVYGALLMWNHSCVASARLSWAGPVVRTCVRLVGPQGPDKPAIQEDVVPTDAARIGRQREHVPVAVRQRLCCRFVDRIRCRDLRSTHAVG